MRAVTLVLSALLLAGCEAIPSVTVSVWHAGTAAPTTFGELHDWRDIRVAPGEPVGDVTIFVSDSADDHRDPKPPSEDQTARAHGGVTGDNLPVLMWTGDNGSARYTELRLFPGFLFPVTRHLRVSADGYTTRLVEIEVGTGQYWLHVPLTRQ